jgi:hypothetical protein
MSSNAGSDQVEELPPTKAEEEQDEEQDEPLAPPEEDVAFAVDIGISRTGDAGSAFHTTNDPAHPLQRTPWTMRKSSALDVRIVCLDVIHGLIGSGPSKSAMYQFATLIVLEFRFDPRKIGRRIASAEVEMVFSGDAPGAQDPIVAAIAPEGRLSMEQTEKTIETTYGVHGKIGAEITPATAHVGAKWERTVGAPPKKNATTVTGSTSLNNRTYGDVNSATWNLMENSMTQTGIPAAMRTAILLHRADEERFRCVFSLKIKADWKSEMSNMGGSTPTDDPVLFDPTVPSTMKLKKFDELELGAVSVDELSDITFMTVVQNAVKSK